jgi:hypothetical protein
MNRQAEGELGHVVRGLSARVSVDFSEKPRWSQVERFGGESRALETGRSVPGLSTDLQETRTESKFFFCIFST